MHLTGIFVADCFDESVFFYRNASFLKSSPGRISMGHFGDRDALLQKDSLLGLDSHILVWALPCFPDLNQMLWTLISQDSMLTTRLVGGRCLSDLPFFFFFFSYSYSLEQSLDRITEWLRLRGTSGDHPYKSPGSK